MTSRAALTTTRASRVTLRSVRRTGESTRVPFPWSRWISLAARRIAARSSSLERIRSLWMSDTFDSAHCTPKLSAAEVIS